MNTTRFRVRHPGRLDPAEALAELDMLEAIGVLTEPEDTDEASHEVAE